MRRLLTAVEAAQLLAITPARFYELARSGRLPGVVRLGRQVRVDADQLEAFIATGGKALDGGWRAQPS